MAKNKNSDNIQCKWGCEETYLSSDAGGSELVFTLRRQSVVPIKMKKGTFKMINYFELKEKKKTLYHNLWLMVRPVHGGQCIPGSDVSSFWKNFMSHVCVLSVLQGRSLAFVTLEGWPLFSFDRMGLSCQTRDTCLCFLCLAFWPILSHTSFCGMLFYSLWRVGGIDSWCCYQVESVPLSKG